MLLKKCCKILSGFAFKSSLFNSENKGIPIVRIRDVGETKSNTFYSGSYSEEYVLNNGDIIIGMDGQFKLAIWNGGNALLNQRVCKLTPNNKLIDKRFLSHILPKSLKEIDCVLHKCDNRKCVRPDHLFEGSNLDNIKDRTKKNRGNGKKIQKITSQQCKEIQELYSTGKYRQKDLAYKFGVDQSHVSRIVNKDSSHRKGL